MKKLAAVVAMLLLAAPAAAEVRSVKVCTDVTLAASTTTDCTSQGLAVDISGFKYFSFQVYCGETTGDSMSVDVDWIAGSATGSAYLAIPLLSTGTAMTQLVTAYTTEDAWRALQSVHPPVSPVATLRFTENNGDADIVCSAILNMGD